MFQGKAACVPWNDGFWLPSPEPTIGARSAALGLDGGSASVREEPAIDDEGSRAGEAEPFPRRQSALAQSRSRRPVAETESNLSDTGPAAPALPSPPVSVQSRR